MGRRRHKPEEGFHHFKTKQVTIQQRKITGDDLEGHRWEYWEYIDLQGLMVAE